MLADFDVARVSGGETTMGMAPGTEPFIAPEVRLSAQVSPKSDMFSFGVTLVRVLLSEVWATRMPKSTGEVVELFQRGGDSALAELLLKSPVSLRRAEVSGGGGGGGGRSGPSVIETEQLKQLTDILTKLLSNDPAKRPTAEETLEHPFFAPVRLVEAAPTTRPRLLAGGACQVHTVTHSGERALATAESSWEQTHFNTAVAQFHLMMGAQRNVLTIEVEVCVNDALTAQFESKREALRAAGKPTGEIWVFHGTGSRVNIESIITRGFIVPPAGAETNGAVHGRGASSLFLCVCPRMLVHRSRL